MRPTTPAIVRNSWAHQNLVRRGEELVVLDSDWHGFSDALTITARGLSSGVVSTTGCVAVGYAMRRLRLVTSPVPKAIGEVGMAVAP